MSECNYDLRGKCYIASEVKGQADNGGDKDPGSLKENGSQWDQSKWERYIQRLTEQSTSEQCAACEHLPELKNALNIKPIYKKE